MPSMPARIVTIAMLCAPGGVAALLPAAADARDLSAVESAEAAKALLGPVCADSGARTRFVAKMIAQGGEYEQRSAKWDLDISCEQVDLPVKPVHDTADPSDAATHRDWIYDARWSPDGKVIATAGRDKTVRIWDVATGKTVRLIDVAALPASKPATGQGMVRHARFLDGGRSIVVAADGHPIRIFNVATGESIGEIPYSHPDPTWEMPPFIDTSAQGLVILGGYGGDIVAWDVNTKSERYRVPGVAREYPYFAIADDPALLAIALPGDGGHVRVQVLELGTGKPIWRFNAKTAVEYKNHPGSVALSRDGRLLAVDVDALVLVFDVANKKPVTRVPAHPYFSGRNLNFTADGKALIGGLTHAMLTDIASGKRIRQFGPFSDNFHAADVSPDGKYLVTGHIGSDGRIWEVSTGTFYRRLGKDVKPPR
jgi:WD40 repeat protein